MKQLVSIRHSDLSRSGYPVLGNLCLLRQIQLPVKLIWKPSLKAVNSSEHSVKGYTDNVTLISNNFDAHVQSIAIDQRAHDLDLSFKPVKCITIVLVN